MSDEELSARRFSRHLHLAERLKMGNQPSRTQQTALAPQTRFPRVVNSRFVLEFAVSLRLPLGFWSPSSEPVEILDADSLAPMFKVNPRANDGKKQLLLDKNGVPIVEMVGYPVTTDCAMYVPQVPRPASLSATQSWQEHRALCYLQTNLRPLEQRLLLELEDPVTRARLNVRVEGSWQTHEALFWADRGVKTMRECIARVYFEPHDRQVLKASRKKKTDGLANEDLAKLSYRVDVAPGVDVAMIVLACAALDDELAKKERGEQVEIGSDEVTRLLAERHHGVRSRDRPRAINGKTMFVISDL